MWFFNNPGLLGINARNLLYIKPYNPKKAVMMADSKLKTKNYLSARGVPVAKLYGVIHDKSELKTFDFATLPNSFVVKPNAGFGGQGIVIIKDRKGVNFLKSNDEIITEEDLISHISDILDGRYSLADISDAALFEQRLEAPDLLRKMAYKGLPDFRIVVHNLIPVMAMLRLPTEKSNGTANIHMGGIGVGIDLAKGELTYATQFGKKIDSIPRFGPVKGIKIPRWSEFLLTASRVQQLTNLGFAAVDMVLDKNIGPALLEINARAGLQVQIANMAPLRRRLERIEGIKVSSPEKGVRIAQDIFGQKIEEKTSQLKSKIIIGTMEWVEVIGKKGTRKIVAKIQPDVGKSVLDEAIAHEIELDETGKCKFSLVDQKVTTVMNIGDFSKEPYQMIIGQRDLNGFIIDPMRKLPLEAKEADQNTLVIKRVFSPKELEKIDQELFEIDSKLKLLAHLRPLNLREENEKFLLNPTYNPQFQYKPLGFDPRHFYSRLKRIEFPETPIGLLWQKKADEIKRKIALLEARDTAEFTEKSMALYGQVDEKLYQLALKDARSMPQEFSKSGRLLNAKEAKRRFERAIEEYGLKGWHVKLKPDMVSDAIAGKENTILIRSAAMFSEDRLKGTIAHEVETHAFTAINGARQPYRIFQRGLADYLTTEEGLAVYNQEKTESVETIKKYWPASSVIGIWTAMQGSFVDVYLAMLEFGFGAQRAWTVALKAKRGLGDTSQPGAFTKDAIYFKGHRMVQEFVAQGGDLTELYYGKTNLEDLDLIKKIKGLKKPLYLPTHLKKKE